MILIDFNLIIYKWILYLADYFIVEESCIIVIYSEKNCYLVAR